MMMYLLVQLFKKITLMLPLSFVLLLGKVIGVIFYFIDRKKRCIAYRNLKLAFPQKTRSEIFSIIKKSFINFGMSFMEHIAASRIIEEGWIDYGGLDKLKGSGIFVGIHSGNWEFYNAAVARKHKFAILVKEQKHKLLERFLNEGRKANNIAVCFSLKQLIRYIKDGYWVGLVVDHGAEDNALFVEFFGSIVPTPQGAVYLAKHFRKKIYPVFGYRVHDKMHVLESALPLDCQDLSTEKALRKLNAYYERFLIRHPEEYMWWYKRFKRKKDLKLIIFSDGKVGHVKQSLTLAGFFKEAGYNVRQEIIEVHIGNKAKRLLLEGCAFFSSQMCVGCLRCIRLLLGKKTFEQLSTMFGDVVISTGSMLAPLTAIVAHSLGAKSVIILKPNLPVKKFSLALIPEHDRLLAPNVVAIKGAFSIPASGSDDKAQLESHFSLSARKKVALFIGGSLENSKDFAKNLRYFLRHLKDFCAKNDYGILVSTSRRSTSEVEELIKKELNGFSQTEILIIANASNHAFILGGFLASAQIVFVTADSISMVSESLSMKKTTVCVELEDILGTHHVNFLESLRGMVNFLKYPYHIRTLTPPPYSLFDYNSRIVKEALGKIL